MDLGSLIGELYEQPASVLCHGTHRIRNAIAVSGIDLGMPGRDPHFGFGRVEVPRALDAAAAPASLVASVDSITFTPSGNGKNQKDLTITVGTVYGLAAPAPATVSLAVYRNGVLQTTRHGRYGPERTGIDAAAQRAGRIVHRVVTSMHAGVLVWDGITPPNGFVK